MSATLWQTQKIFRCAHKVIFQNSVTNKNNITIASLPAYMFYNMYLPLIQNGAYSLIIALMFIISYITRSHHRLIYKPQVYK